MVTESVFNLNDPLWEVLKRLAINLIVLFIIIKLIYNKHADKKGYLFAFFLMGIIIFMLCAVLKSVELSMGMAFGLFAIFSIIRYRTKNIPIKEMSYLFTVIGVSAMNALLDYPNPIRGTILVNSIVIVTVFILEISFKKENKKDKLDTVVIVSKTESLNQVLVEYGNMELLNPVRIDELKNDVFVKTGIIAEKIQIKRIDLNNGNAELDIFYRDVTSKY